jgi:hypothetical protein
MAWVFFLSLLAQPTEAVVRTQQVGAVSFGAPPAASVPAPAPGLDLRRSTFAVERLSASAQGAQEPDSPDSLTNGIIIGAIVGAAALGTFAGVLCKAMQEPDGPSCVDDTLRIAAVGAAIGVGAGIAIDAAYLRNGGVTVSVRKRF